MICDPRCDLSWRMFRVHLKRLYSEAVVCHIYYTSIWSNWLIVLFKIFFTYTEYYWTFFILITASNQYKSNLSETEIPLTMWICLYLLSSIKSSFNFCFMHFEVMLLFAYVLGMISSWLTNHFVIMKCSFISNNTPCLEVYFVWYLYSHTRFYG